MMWRIRFMDIGDSVGGMMHTGPGWQFVDERIALDRAAMLQRTSLGERWAVFVEEVK